MSLVVARNSPNLNRFTIDSMRFCEYVFEKLSGWQLTGLKAALLTLVNVEGSSPRPVGSQLAVNEAGEYVGLISGGCLEAALVAEAQICIRENKTKCIRYGRDSDYFDIRLPCGSGVDVLIQPITPKDTWLQQICLLQRARQPFVWRYDIRHKINTVITSGLNVLDNSEENKQYSRDQMLKLFHIFQKSYLPRHRIVVLGDGEVFDYFIQLSQSFDLDIFAYCTKSVSPKISNLQQNEQLQVYSIDHWSPSVLDRWTTLVFLSHEHSLEYPILLQALATDVSFITALGSKNTHQIRIQHLLNCGVRQQRLGVLKGPAGLDLGCQNPPEIALSILSEIISKKNQLNQTP